MIFQAAQVGSDGRLQRVPLEGKNPEIPDFQCAKKIA